MIRERLKAAQIAAMKAGDKPRTATIRLIQSQLKNRDIELRGAEKAPEDDALVTEVPQKMIKQRREAITMYEQGGRQELAAAEKADVAGIEDFLPQQMSAAEAHAAFDQISATTRANTDNEPGKVRTHPKYTPTA